MTNRRMKIDKLFYNKMEAKASKRKNDNVIRNSILNVGLDETALDHKSKTNMQHSFSL